MQVLPVYTETAYDPRFKGCKEPVQAHPVRQVDAWRDKAGPVRLYADSLSQDGCRTVIMMMKRHGMLRCPDAAIDKHIIPRYDKMYNTLNITTSKFKSRT